MKSIICDNSWQEKWDDFVKQNANDGGLFQSWTWGEFQISLGRKVTRLAVIDDSENIISAVQLIRHNLPLRKSYLYAARGPISNDPTSPEYKILLQEIKRLAAKSNSTFFRMDPALPDNPETATVLKNLGFKFVGEVQPKSTLILDLTQGEEELLAQMKSKTRYNIKVAQKHCIEIADGAEYFDDFWRLMQKTAKRDRIKVHSKKHYQKMLAVLAKENMMKLIVAKFDNKVVAANLVVFFGKWCFYLHGASDYEFRDKMAPYLLQWETIQLARSHWCENYDFCGANETRWPGVTRFKAGFAPNREFTVFVGAWDMPIKHLEYLGYKLLNKIKGRK